MFCLKLGVEQRILFIVSVFKKSSILRRIYRDAHDLHKLKHTLPTNGSIKNILKNCSLWHYALSFACCMKEAVDTHGRVNKNAPIIIFILLRIANEIYTDYKVPSLNSMLYRPKCILIFLYYLKYKNPTFSFTLLTFNVIKICLEDIDFI